MFGYHFPTRSGGLNLVQETLSLGRMEYDKDKVDEMVLALLFLTLHEDGRAWKGHDWDAMDRLHQKGLISNPVGKAKSVVLTEDGEKRCRELFQKHFCGRQGVVTSPVLPKT
jgi:hypothetical protein